MWVRYTGKITYNSMEVRGFKPNTSKSLTDDVARHLIKKYPKLFHLSKPEIIKGVLKGEEKEIPKEEKKEEVKK